MKRLAVLPSFLFRFLILLLAAGLGGAAYTAEPGGTPAAPEALTGFATVTTAITARVGGPGAAAATQPGYLGVSTSVDSRGRLVVSEVGPDSPAARAGLQAGDVLLQMGGQPVRTPEALRDLLLSRTPGVTLRMEVERQGKPVEVAATLGATSRPMKLSERRAQVGIIVGESEADIGVPIRRVMPGSPASRAGVREGDVLLKVEGRPVTFPAMLGDSVAEKQPGDMLTLTLFRDRREMEVQVQLGGLPGDEGFGFRGGGGSPPIWTADRYRLAVIRVEFPDFVHNSAVTTTHWEEALFSSGRWVNRNSPTGQTVFGSLNDYYQEQSCKAFRVEGKVFEWVEVRRKRADYAQDDGPGGRWMLFTEAIDLLLARDGAQALDGFDGLLFLYAGDRFPTNRGGIFWPHRASMVYRGRRWPYLIVPDGGAQMANISILCHEFGHMLGLPDLYDRPENPGSEGLGTWCAMSNEAGGGRPQHLCAWCKERLGWLKPAILDPTVKQKLVLGPVEGSPRECYKVLVRPDGSEYLLLENRRRTGFDRSLPAEGLLIWRVVGNRPLLEESHGLSGPIGPRVFLSSVPYPSAANDAFTPYTTPSSRSQLGGGLPVQITNIRALPDGRITFYVGYEFE